jgi:D-alanyl-D-alanine carboxypeptidase
MARVHKQRTYLQIAGCLLAIGCSQTRERPTPVALASHSALSDRLDRCFKAQSYALPFSGIVVARRGSETFTRAAGSLEPGNQATPRTDVPYRLASVSKVITTVAVGQLIDAGRLSFEDQIGTYLPQLPPSIAVVTIEQLIQHRSGVVSLGQLGPESFEIIMRARTAHDLLPLVVNHPLAFEPGSRQQYSNGGYFLLGAVVEAVTGRVFADHLREALFEPLEMRDSSLDPGHNAAHPMTRMTGPGLPLAERPQPVRGPFTQRGTPAGSGLSSAEDLVKLGQALLGDRLLSSTVKQRLFPKKVEVWRIGQSGGSIGANTDFSVFPESGWVLVVLSNYDPPAAELMGQVLRTFIVSGECKPLSEGDRPSPFRPPPGGT